MIELVGKLLSKFNYPCNHILRPNFIRNKNAVISYHFYNLQYAIHGDGKGREYEQSLQIDIFFKKDIGDLDRKIIDELTKHKFKFSGEDEYTEDIGTIRLYRKVLTFNFLESEVKR